jgi:hypothetical protein
VSSALDAIHLGLLIVIVYDYTIVNWGDIGVLTRKTWYAATEFS